jgi:TonB-linked SusC/RagA family outer membrane protein
MKKKIVLMLTCLLCVCSAAMAQTKVTGTVISASDNEPVIGASVVVTGTRTGVQTDMKGHFTLNVPRNAKTLQISYVGMKTVNVAIKSNMKVYLEDDNRSLDEVMVVAYGTSTKSAFTGSAAVVNSDEIGKIQASNPASSLTGKMSGVQLVTSTGQPGGSNPTIRIRGISSINAGNDPLIILDGSPYDGDLNNLNSQDIESMTVLKDAASNALYGSRAANGVILITTKKGSSNGAKVTIDAKVGGNSRATQNYNYIKNPAQYYEMYYSALKQYFVNQGMSDTAAGEAANTNMTSGNDYGLGYNVYTVPDGQYLIGSNGKLNPNATLGRTVTYNGKDYLLRPDNWLDEAYKNSLRQEYNATVSAGTDKSSFYTSIGYLNNEGITANSNYERLTGRMKADYQVKPWLKVGANMSYTHYQAKSLSEDGTSNSSGNVFAAATQVAPIYPLYMRDGNGKVMVDADGNTMYDYGDGTNAGLSRPVFTSTNAISDAILNTNSSNGNAINAVGFFEIKFLKDFKFTSTNSANVDETRYNYVTNPYYGAYKTSNGIVTVTHARGWSYNYQQLLDWSHAFNLHHVAAMVGHEYFRHRYYELSGDKSNMFDPTNHELDGAVKAGTASSYFSDYNTEGYFGRLQYDFNEKYFASVSFRRDASSRFAKENRWGNFYSAGGAWIISKENFMKPTASWLDMLKLKASYGEQGNDQIGNYRYVSTYSIKNSGGNVAAVPSTLGNKDITWETDGVFNTGVDFEFLKGRLSGSFEYFYRKTTDMLFSFPLPPSYGYTSYYANVGDMRNSGVELELNGTILKVGGLQWDARFNITHYKNKITYLPEERKTMTVDGVKGYSSGNYFYGEGIPLYTFRLKKYAGVAEDGQSQWYVDKTATDEATGKTTTTREKTTSYSDASYYLCGTALPDAYGGFGTTLTYKGFDLSADFSYQLGGQCLDGDYERLMSSPQASDKGSNFSADLLKAWSATNTSSDIPRFVFGDTYSSASSDRWLTSAKYLSIQNITAGYSLPTSLCRKAGLEKVRFYVVADNVWFWSARQGLDPRQSIAGDGNNTYYSPMRSVSGGITLTF